MKGKGLGIPLSAVVICITVVLFSFGIPGQVSPAQATSGITSIEILHFDDDGLREPLQDLSGNDIGYALHTGDLSCNRQICNGRSYLTSLILASQSTDIEIEYKFKSVLARDLVQQRVVVAGTGTITSEGYKERFTFTATLQNNRDGTLSSTYVASRSDASFYIAHTSGTYVYGGQQ